MLKKIALVLAVLVAGVLVLAALQPDTFRMERSTTIAASPDKIFPLVNDFHNITKWSPFEKLDPTMKHTYGGPTAGKGATFAWDGNNKAGAGHQEITESVPNRKVVFALHFTKPFQGDDFTEYTLTQQGATTKVTWAMYGPSPYFHKLITLFCSMDKLMGPTFEEGLANLKTLAEKH